MAVVLLASGAGLALTRSSEGLATSSAAAGVGEAGLVRPGATTLVVCDAGATARCTGRLPREQADRYVRGVNSAPPVPARSGPDGHDVVVHCPMDRGTAAELTFLYPDGSFAQVQAGLSGCSFISPAGPYTGPTGPDVRYGAGVARTLVRAYPWLVDPDPGWTATGGPALPARTAWAVLRKARTVLPGCVGALTYNRFDGVAHDACRQGGQALDVSLVEPGSHGSFPTAPHYVRGPNWIMQSPDRALLEQAARATGGTVDPG